MQFKTIAEVFWFYILQSIPQGLIYGSIPFLFQQFQKQFILVDYLTCISIFTMSSYPFTLKLLWSPFIDFCIVKFQSCKFFFTITQLFTCILFFGIGSQISSFDLNFHFLNEHSTSIYVFTFYFTLIAFCMTIHDIALDNFSIEQFTKQHASATLTSCQSIGSAVGFLVGNIILLLFSTPEVSQLIRSYLQPSSSVVSNMPLVTLEQFAYGMMCVYLISALYTLVFVRDFHHHFRTKTVVSLDLSQSYISMWHLLSRSQMVQDLIVVVSLPMFSTFMLVETLVPFQILDKGYPKEHLAAIVAVLFPFDIIYSIVVGQLLKKHALVKVWRQNFWFRLLVSQVLCVGAVFFLPQYQSSSNATPILIYGGVLVGQLLFAFPSKAVYLSQHTLMQTISQRKDEASKETEHTVLTGTFMSIIQTCGSLCFVGAKQVSLFIVPFAQHYLYAPLFSVSILVSIFSILVFQFVLEPRLQRLAAHPHPHKHE